MTEELGGSAFSQTMQAVIGPGGLDLGDIRVRKTLQIVFERKQVDCTRPSCKMCRAKKEGETCKAMKPPGANTKGDIDGHFGMFGGGVASPPVLKYIEDLVSHNLLLVASET